MGTLCALKRLGFFGVFALASFGYGQTDQLSVLIHQLRDSDVDGRTNAAKALGETRDSRAVEPLVGALNDRDGSVVAAAEDALGEIKDPRAVEPLIVKLKNNADYPFAANALGKIKDPRAIEPLITALKNNKWPCGDDVADALGAIGSPAVELLIRNLQGPDEIDKRHGPGDIRGYVAKALGVTRDPRAVEPLIAALKDTEHSVVISSEQALGEIKDPRAVEALMAALRGAGFPVSESSRRREAELCGGCFGLYRFTCGRAPEFGPE